MDTTNNNRSLYPILINYTVNDNLIIRQIIEIVCQQSDVIDTLPDLHLRQCPEFLFLYLLSNSPSMRKVKST